MTTTAEPIRVLFLCSHNSARSQIAEAVLRDLGGNDFAAFSAGTEVTRVHPLAVRVLQAHGLPTDGLYSKHMRDVLGPHFDVVITLCDSVVEACPLFPGDTERYHWSFPDPSAVEGTEEERMRAFGEIRIGLIRRLKPFIEAQRNKRRITAPA